MGAYNEAMEKENKKTKSEEVATINELAVIMRDSFQSNQEYMDKKFDAIDKKFDHVTEKINNISLNIVDTVRKEDFDKLEDRVDVVEGSLDLKLKRV